MALSSMIRSFLSSSNSLPRFDRGIMVLSVAVNIMPPLGEGLPVVSKVSFFVTRLITSWSNFMPSGRCWQ